MAGMDVEGLAALLAHRFDFSHFIRLYSGAWNEFLYRRYPRRGYGVSLVFAIYGEVGLIRMR
jgi:hypothetical protein